METVGFELEIGNNGERATRVLRGLGLTLADAPHRKRCLCKECDPFSAGPPFYVQKESRCAVEFISKCYESGSKVLDQGIEGLANALRHADAKPSLLDGMHVHVGREGHSNDELIRLASLVAVHQDELAELAASEFSRVRHDAPDDRHADIDGTVYALARSGAHPVGHVPRRFITSVSAVWFHARPTTVEFRVWNATSDAWRMRLALGVSVALMRAARNGAKAETLTGLLEPNMSDEVRELVERQRARPQGERKTLLPSMREIAHEREHEHYAVMFDVGRFQIPEHRPEDQEVLYRTP